MSILLQTLPIGARGYVTGLGTSYSFTVVSQGPGGTRVTYDKRIVNHEFKTLDKITGEEKTVKFTKPAETVLISGGTVVTQLATDTDSTVYKTIMAEQNETPHVIQTAQRTRKTSIAPKLLVIPDESASAVKANRRKKTKRKRKSS
jgi:hypothetical protein